MRDIILQAQNLHFAYDEITILKNLNLTLHEGENIAIVGASGSGKSTLLHILAGLDLPQAGEISICGQNINHAVDKQRTRIRNQYMGFVYQFHHLLPEFDARENVAMPLLIQGEKKSTALEKADHLLEQVGLAERRNHLPSELSGGERQRTAIARALINNPKCLLADEPTGNLDQERAQQTFELMKSLIKAHHGAMIIVTHDLELAKQMEQCFHLNQGQLIQHSQTI